MDMLKTVGIFTALNKRAARIPFIYNFLADTEASLPLQDLQIQIKEALSKNNRITLRQLLESIKIDEALVNEIVAEVSSQGENFDGNTKVNALELL